MPSDDFFKRLASNITSFGSRSILSNSIRSKPSQVFHSDASGKGQASTSIHSIPHSQGWLELNEANSRGAAWTETGSGRDRWEGKEPNAIKVRRSVEVV
jgi:hypothetical protein